MLMTSAKITRTKSSFHHSFLNTIESQQGSAPRRSNCDTALHPRLHGHWAFWSDRGSCCLFQHLKQIQKSLAKGFRSVFTYLSSDIMGAVN